MLLPFAWIYAVAVFSRNLAYNQGWWKTYRLSIPVISIGNLSVGGTGKTPLAMAIGQMLRKSPYHAHPALLSRGYRRQSQGFQLVSDGKKVLCAWRDSGDEPQLLARRLPGVPVAVDKDRLQGGMKLIEQVAPGAIILDDGFQHRRLHRDLDVVLLDAEKDIRGRLLPAGLLREPLGSLRRAHLIALTRFEQQDPSSQALWQTCVQLFGQKRLLACRYRPCDCYDLRTAATLPLDHLQGKPLLPFCGLARPESFLRSLEHLGAVLSVLIRFPDHHDYHLKDLERLAEAYARLKPDYLITTEKDAVKLDGLFQALPILVLRIEIEWLKGYENLQRELARVLKVKS